MCFFEECEPALDIQREELFDVFTSLIRACESMDKHLANVLMTKKKLSALVFTVSEQMYSMKRLCVNEQYFFQGE